MNAHKLRNGVVKYSSEGWYVIPHSRWRSQVSTMKSRMSSQKPSTTTVPAAAVLTHVLHLLMYLLLYLRTYCTYYCTYCTRTYYTYCCAVCTTYYCTADVRTYIYTSKYVGKKALLQSWRSTCTYWWCTYVYWRKKLPAALSTHLLHILLFLLMCVRTHRTYF